MLCSGKVDSVCYRWMDGDIEDINLYYAILLDYCNLYNYVATLLDNTV